MEQVENATYFRCVRCGKDVTHIHTIYGVCCECIHLEALGVRNIEDYNEYLKRRKG